MHYGPSASTKLCSVRLAKREIQLKIVLPMPGQLVSVVILGSGHCSDAAAPPATFREER
jgi:hypothetical protein